eukprot:10962089-Alexandrium_andersonii.AAC.1
MSLQPGRAWPYPRGPEPGSRREPRRAAASRGVPARIEPWCACHSPGVAQARQKREAPPAPG